MFRLLITNLAVAGDLMHKQNMNLMNKSSWAKATKSLLVLESVATVADHELW